jgi:hypothetical protein
MLILINKPLPFLHGGNGSLSKTGDLKRVQSPSELFYSPKRQIFKYILTGEEKACETP